ncbi:amidohydrolase family protein [Salibacterium aidingense]|uniref:amidohydrolase family protein n=1 Tax=Salibacterium aidingense TaxID=384933 RepID=UPI003BCC0D5D
MLDLCLNNVRLEGEVKQIGIKNDCIQYIGPEKQEAHSVIEAGGAWLLPPFVESHIHLDTAWTYGSPYVNHSGQLLEGIEVWGRYKKEKLSEEEVRARALQVIQHMAAQGILYMRTMVDVSDPELMALKVLIEVKKQVAPYVELQIIAFPQLGLAPPGNGAAQLKRALALGADGVSAVPHLENTREKGVESLETCFGIGVEHQTFVHIFCDETDDPESRFLEVAADLAVDSGLYHKVAVSHANAMAYYNEAYVKKLLPRLAASAVHVVTCPLINSAMQGRFDRFPKGRGITRVKELLEYGISVSCAHDDFQSPFYPLGDGSLLTAGHMLAHLAHMTGSEDFPVIMDMLTTYPADLMGINSYEIREGGAANLILLPALDARDALRRQPVPQLVISNGTVLAETPAQKTSIYSEIFSTLEERRHL